MNAVVEVPLDRVAVRKATQRFVGLHNVFELRDFLEGTHEIMQQLSTSCRPLSKQRMMHHQDLAATTA